MWQRITLFVASIAFAQLQSIIDYQFLRSMIEQFNIEVLVETSGTIDSEILLQIMPHLRNIYLVRNDDSLYVRTGKLFKEKPSVHVYPGPSIDSLSLFLPFIKGKTLFILGCNDPMVAQQRQYNLLFQDIRAIIACAINNGVILVDNAHYFYIPYPTERYVRCAISDINAHYQFTKPTATTLLAYIP